MAITMAGLWLFTALLSGLLFGGLFSVAMLKREYRQVGRHFSGAPQQILRTADYRGWCAPLLTHARHMVGTLLESAGQVGNVIQRNAVSLAETWFDVDRIRADAASVSASADAIAGQAETIAANSAQVH